MQAASLLDWAIYRGDKKANQFSELDQINSDNVTDLEVAWQYNHGDPIGPSMYSNPIMVDGLLYFTTPRVNAVAIDATPVMNTVVKYTSCPVEKPLLTRFHEMPSYSCK